MAGGASKKAPEVQLVAKNRRALHNYTVIDKVEAGIVLTGSEVKSLRDGKLQLGDAYATVERGEMFLHHAHISEYRHSGPFNHDPVRPRKLLLHRAEIDRLWRKVQEKGLTLVPLEVYFLRGRAKVMLGLCKGKALHDKRSSLREKDDRREAARAVRNRE